MPSTPSKEVQLPESLRDQLDDFKRQLWRTKIAEAVFSGIAGLLLSYLIVFALDRVWPTPAVVRLGILLAGASLMAVFAPLLMHRWIWKHRRKNQLARLIARKHPGLGDRLLGVIELQRQSESDDTLSPRLRAAAMESVAADVARRKLDDSLPSSLHRRWSLAVIALFIIAAGTLAFVPQAGLNSLKRWLMPLSATPRYTFTVLDHVPQQIAIPQGEAFNLKLHLSESSEWQPEYGSARFDRQDPVSAALDEGTYLFEFPGQQETNMLRVAVGDARYSIRIVPSLRPTIQRTIADISFPEYLQLDDRSVDLPAGLAEAVEGSMIRFTIETTRALDSASFGPVESADPAQAINGQNVHPMKLNGPRATTEWLDVANFPLRVPLRWTDHLGLEGDRNFSIRLEGRPDEAPTCFFEGINSQLAILPEETLDFEVFAHDDFGLREYGIEWSGQTSYSSEGVPALGELALKAGEPGLTRDSTPTAFSPATLGIAPQKLVLRAYAEDYLPDRPRSYSSPIIIHVLSRDEHAQMLKHQFDRAISELEDLARKERGLFEENQRLERLDASELREDDAAKRLEKQQRAEAEQIEAMKEIAESIEKLLQDAARNETIDEDTMRMMAEVMGATRELSEQDMPQVGEHLEGAGDQRNTDEKSENEMEDAVEKQEELLEKMRETLEKANQANQRFEAGTFANRLKEASRDESAISSSILEQEQQFGLSPEELDPKDLGILNEIIRRQSGTTSDVRWLKDDLAHFFTRTGKEEFGKLLEEMNESRIELGLEDVRIELAKAHHNNSAREAKRWADQLMEWAKLLEGDQDDGAGGGGGGGGGGGEEEDFEFMLRVMKLVQQEQDLRGRTRALETLRRAQEEKTQTPGRP